MADDRKGTRADAALDSLFAEARQRCARRPIWWRVSWRMPTAVQAARHPPSTCRASGRVLQQSPVLDRRSRRLGRLRWRDGGRSGRAGAGLWSPDMVDVISGGQIWSLTGGG
jgi:hypothetical protein